VLPPSGVCLAGDARAARAPACLRGPAVLGTRARAPGPRTGGLTAWGLHGLNRVGGHRLAAAAARRWRSSRPTTWNLWAAINRRPLLRFQYQHLGDMMSLGRRDGAVALPFAPPAPLAAALQRSPLLPLLSAAGIRRAAPAGRRAAL